MDNNKDIANFLVSNYNLKNNIKKGSDLYYENRFDEALKNFMKHEDEKICQNKIGIIYYKKKDLKNAILWLNKASNQGYSNSCIILASMYKFGNGVNG